jgi:putative inorganic carbon (hco3(-)) transporter
MAITKKSNLYLLAGWVKEMFFEKRMNSIPGWVLMASVGIGLAYAGSEIDIKAPIFIAGGFFGVLFVLICFRYPEFSYYFFICSCITFALPTRLAGLNIPLGPAVEGSGYLCIFCIIAEQYRKRTTNAKMWKSPISLMMLLLFFYLMLEGLNPEINSSWAGWGTYMRKQILYLVFYFTTYLMLDSYEKIIRFIKVWVFICVVVAIWAIKQQWFGFSYFEEAWIYSDPNIATLLFQGGMFRKFSLLTDPASFGVMAASSALFTLVLAIRGTNKKRNWVLYIVTFMLIIASSYSGTRTCNVMIIGGLMAYIIFTLNERKTIIVLIFSILAGGFLLFGPFKNNPVILRINTTFDAKNDPSNIVRNINRKNIQPYIYQHPMGGGLNTCGEEGRMLYPWHQLAGYPPDSGYMKIMLEQGWVGLILNVVFYFIILQTGISGFYNARKKDIKTLYIAFTVCFFSLVVGQYSQLAISQYPQYFFYLATLVIFYKLKEYDTKNPATHEQIIT